MQRLAWHGTASASLNGGARRLIMGAMSCASCSGRIAPVTRPIVTTSLARSSWSGIRPALQLSSAPARYGRRCAVQVAGQAAAVEAPSSSTSRTIKPFSKQTRIAEIKGEASASYVGQDVELRGWVRTVRNQKTFSFLEVNDGSCLAGLQVVVQPEVPGYDLLTQGGINTGAAVRVQGSVVESPGGKQAVEVRAALLELVGGCDVDSYPLQKKRHSLEFLRSLAHLRPRTNTIGAVMRLRSALAYATHTFFQGAGFQYVHTPILSASDCEGAGEMFQVTTLVSDYERALGSGPPSPEALSELQAAVSAAGGQLKQAKEAAKAAPDTKPQVDAALQRLLGLKEQLAAAQAAAAASSGLPRTEAGGVNYADDFFGRPTYLTVSGQLNGEMYASALGNIYTFGPTFRAENSNTSRHLAEFWMIEPELAFADLDDDMACAQAYLKHCVRHVLEHCQEDLAFFDKQYEKGLIARLQDVADKPFATVTYTRAVELLTESGVAFEYPVKWGADLQSEHERWLTEVAFKRTPLIVTDYPKDIKAFYMRLNEDGKTVAAMDLLVPGVGELMGGSQREERLDVLQQRMRDSGLDPEEYWWYLDLRRYGSVPHAGFGLGFERLVQFATGMENIRDVIPFPRYPGHCEF